MELNNGMPASEIYADVNICLKNSSLYFIKHSVFEGKDAKLVSLCFCSNKRYTHLKKKLSYTQDL